MITRKRHLFLACAALALSPSLAQAQSAPTYSIAAQDIGRALTQLARESNREVYFSADLTRGKRAPALRGQFTFEQALERMLANSGLTYRINGGGSIIIERAAAQASGGEADAGSVAAKTESAEDEQEIVVTGTNIRGGTRASPRIVIDRDDIERSGLATTQQLIERVTQHFGGSVSETTVGALTGGLSGSNVAFGNGLDLRGLGTDSTLVLINGRRVASTGIGNFVDLSLIPLTAVERVDIVPDGASAIYGSDAVGGVANFILRDDFDGAESTARFGLATDGGSREYQLGQIIGTTWNGGSALFSYEFYKRGELRSSDRSFTEGLENPFELLPEQRRHSVFLTTQQDINDSVSVFADVLYAKRRSKLRFTTLGFTSIAGADTDQFGVTAGSRVRIGRGWLAELRGTYDRNKTDQLDENASDFTGNSVSADVKADGPLFAIGGGDVRLAIGGQYRRETYDRKRTDIDVHGGRNVFAAFGEILVPFVGADNGAPGLRQLELTAAARVDRYSDFGTTVNPKVGLLWSPSAGLKVRASYGTAFKAPLLFELDESDVLYLPFPAEDPTSPAGITNTIAIFGGNRELEPEKAKTFSAGIDYSPPSMSALDLSVTYFAVNFRDRIGDPPSDLFFAFGFNAEDLLGPFLTRNVDQALVQDIASRPGFDNFFGILLEEITAIGDFRTTNLARTRVKGIDASISYGFETGIGRMDLGLNATYLIDHKTQLTPTVGLLELVDTRFNPVDLVVVTSASLSRGGWTASAFVNYTDSYKDPTSDIDQVFDIDSWTTLDLACSYNTGKSAAPRALRNLKFTLNASNLFDSDPPFVRNEFGLNYDGANASPLGRFVSFQVTKKW